MNANIAIGIFLVSFVVVILALGLGLGLGLKLGPNKLTGSLALTTTGIPPSTALSSSDIAQLVSQNPQKVCIPKIVNGNNGIVPTISLDVGQKIGDMLGISRSCYSSTSNASSCSNFGFYNQTAFIFSFSKFNGISNSVLQNITNLLTTVYGPSCVVEIACQMQANQPTIISISMIDTKYLVSGSIINGSTVSTNNPLVFVYGGNQDSVNKMINAC